MHEIFIEMDGVIIDSTFTWMGLELKAVEGGIAVSISPEHSPKEMQRTVSILRGYLNLWRVTSEEQDNELSKSELPNSIGDDALFAVWFERACHAENEAQYLRFCYNAFGALPDGFAMADTHMRHFIGDSLTEKMLTYNKLMRADEDDLAEHAPANQTIPTWTQEELDRIRDGLLQGWKEAYSSI